MMEVADGKQIDSRKACKRCTRRRSSCREGGEFQICSFRKSLQMSYGMGWFIQDYGGHQICLHPGDIDGFASLVVLIPEVKTGFVIIDQFGSYGTTRRARLALDRQFLGLPQQDWTAHFTKVADELPRRWRKTRKKIQKLQNIRTLIRRRNLAAYAGTYRNQRVW